MIGEIKMNEEILTRLATYRNQNWNPVIEKILENDARFWKYETPTIDREVYFLTNQLIDILKLVKEGRIHKVQYEFADLVSMGLGYMMIYGNPLSTLEYRMSINHSVKGEKNIVEKYENRFVKYGKFTLSKLEEILAAHSSEEYFKRNWNVTSP